jgi:hypothetical protein
MLFNEEKELKTGYFHFTVAAKALPLVLRTPSEGEATPAFANPRGLIAV